MKHFLPIREIIAKVLCLEDDSIDPAHRLLEDLDVSNLAFLEILLEIEKVYGLQKIPEALSGTFLTVSNLCTFVEASMNFHSLITKRVAQSARTFMRSEIRTLTLGLTAAHRFLRMALADFPHFFSLRPNVCFVCGCTPRRACFGGCAWTDATRTLCTVCKFGNADHVDAVIPYRLVKRSSGPETFAANAVPLSGCRCTLRERGSGHRLDCPHS